MVFLSDVDAGDAGDGDDEGGGADDDGDDDDGAGKCLFKFVQCAHHAARTPPRLRRRDGATELLL